MENTPTPPRSASGVVGLQRKLVLSQLNIPSSRKNFSSWDKLERQVKFCMVDEHNTEEREDSQNDEGMDITQWIQDNLRIIISIIIVIALAGGIYSYSQRTTTPIVTDKGTENGLVAETPDEESDGTTGIVAENGSAQDTKIGVTKDQPSVATSKETQGSFAESAGSGDGLTHLARRALADYLEKNPDTSLTAEHKIYIEDYLRKNVSQPGPVRIGTTVEFPKDLIRQSIDHSKQLSGAQLKNLEKYSAMVPSLK